MGCAGGTPQNRGGCAAFVSLKRVARGQAPSLGGRFKLGLSLVGQLLVMRVLIVLVCLFLIPCALSAQDSSLCEGQQYDFDGDNVVGVGDVLSVLSWFGTVLDADQDGTLDCNDDCVGVYDECGVCNGPGPQVQVLDTIIITYDSIYVEAINDWVTYELGADSVFTLQCEDPGNFNACGDPIAMDGLQLLNSPNRRPMLVCGEPAHDGLRQRRCDSCGLDGRRVDVDHFWSHCGVRRGQQHCYNYSPDIDACDESAVIGGVWPLVQLVCGGRCAGPVSERMACADRWRVDGFGELHQFTRLQRN